MEVGNEFYNKRFLTNAYTYRYKTQFVWGILSAFDKSTHIDINNLSVIPTFDGEWKYGGEDVHTQHPLAIAEIVCVDSSYTIFLSKDEDLSDRFLRHYSDAQDLHRWNKKRLASRLSE